MRILMTNDDGPDSPLFRLAVKYCQSMGDVDVKGVVPAEEQSWKGKAMTRFGSLRLQSIDGFGCEMYTFSGTPADCANLGIYHLFDGIPPDLVVSGINMGSNAGLGYASASGTVGAALEANIADVPAVAFSQAFPRDLFDYWVEYRALRPDKEEEMCNRCWAMMDRAFAYLKEQEDFMYKPITWNVNFPRDAADEWQVLPALLGHALYTSCFKLFGNTYRHDVDSPVIEEREGTDGVVLRDGNVSVTRLDIRSFGR